jgi:ABC-type Mn2+/Zn2+ transport system ATPase subunit
MRGSEWRRWDPHLHAPGTLLNDQFGGDWDAYLAAIERAAPPVTALGVTDYFCIRTYKEVKRLKSEGRLAGVALLFPNVEMRMEIKTDRAIPINLHLLFSPDDPRHEIEIERALQELRCEFGGRLFRCRPDDLMEIGRLKDPSQRDDLAALRAGAQQFKVELSNLRELFRGNEWMRRNCLVAVAGGRNDGTSGLQTDDSYLMTRREIESFADMVFASTPSQREFWLGKRSLNVEAIEATYRALKPCLHGSDAHADDQVLAPAQNRFTWLKGDATFETLRQAVLEPEDRVWIGPSPPTRGASVPTIKQLRTSDATWFGSDDFGPTAIDLNPGLVTIIGERGSGKTALLEIIARGANASRGSDRSSASFLHRATTPVDLIGAASIELEWSDDSTTTAPMRPDDADLDPWDADPSAARYLSQQFVDQLCSATGLATELRAEIERVVFDATPRGERLDSTSFAQLAAIRLDPVRDRREEWRRAITAVGDRIERADSEKARLPAARTERSTVDTKLQAARQELGTLLPTGKDERTKRLLELETACAASETAIEAQRRRLQRIKDLEAHVLQVRTTMEPQRFKLMKGNYAAAGLSADDWSAFMMDFTGEVESVSSGALEAVEKCIAMAIDGDPENPSDPATAPLTRWPHAALVAERDKLKAEVGIDTQKQGRYDVLSRNIGLLDSALHRFDEEIKHAEGAEARRAEAVQDRRDAYAQVFATLVEEEAILAALYGPLSAEIGASHGTVTKIALVVEREIDLASWVSAGEELLDLRSATMFRRGALAGLAEKHLLPAWRTGDAEAVAAAMSAFVEQIQEDAKRARPPSVEDRAAWGRDVARWLYSTAHVRIQYAITYDGIRIEQLSPGTRGIVLLLLYLVLDRQDERPLLIDQPEENLDPKSVFDELVPHFREARKRRQVIMVTHNANLVVNTDADQVFVASAKHDAAGGLPAITYQVGTLENPETRKAVCATLEGGERAFLERAKRYRLRWNERGGGAVR